MLVGVLLALLAARALALATRPLPKEPFAPHHRDLFARARPEVIFVGSSMLDSRLPPYYISQIAAPTRIGELFRPNLHSTSWFFMLKNQVVASGVKPRRVVFFMREAEATRPGAPFGGADRRRLEKDMLPEEPVLREVQRSFLAGSPIARWRAQVLGPLERVVPTMRLRRGFQRPLEAIPLASANWLTGRTSAKQRKKDLNRLFDWKKLRGDRRDQRPVSRSTATDFHRMLPMSFLPPLLDLVEREGFEAWFVHVEMKKHLDGAPRSDEMTTYLAELRRYLEGRGAHYLDLHDENLAPTAWFDYTDHVRKTFRKAYARRFLAQLPQLFR